jgi:quercetin dioxygenase-like cupin family protein
VTPLAAIEDAQVVLPCAELNPSLSFFTELGFRLDAIHPADDPRVAVLSGYGVRIRLERGAPGAPGTLRLACRDPQALGGGAAEVTAPNGTRVLLVATDARAAMPRLRASLALSRARDATSIEGRAGMRYRDLLPDRLGGALIASHITIPGGGPVPDYVHFHAVAFQMIYCAKGWVRVVYEDQGEPFVLHEGDCALQPPRIRHRVLEASPGLEVVEVSSPAEHETFAEHELALPTSVVRAERDFGGQRFVRHEASTATYRPWRQPGFAARDLGIAAATAGRVAARVVRRGRDEPASIQTEPPDLQLAFVIAGEVRLDIDGRDAGPLTRADAFCVPRGSTFTLADASGTFEMLEVVVPDYARLAVPRSALQDVEG